VLLPSASCLGISKLRGIYFEPNLNQDFAFCVTNSKDTEFPVMLTKSGALAEYLTFKDSEFTLKPRERKCTEFNLKLPRSLDTYGPHKIKLTARQVTKQGEGAIRTIVAVNTRLGVFVPYPEKYVSVSVKAKDVNENEPVQFQLLATNLGQKDVDAVSARLDIFGADDYSNFVTSLYTDTKSIKSTEKETFYSTFNTHGLKPGNYKTDVTLYYDGETSEKEKRFKIGTLNIRITNHTAVLEAGKINPFDVIVESRWNNEIPKIYARIELDGIKPATTPTFSLSAWKVKSLLGYVDLSEQEPGILDGKITVFYMNQTKIEEITVEVVEEIMIEEKPVITGVPVVEEPISDISGIKATSIMLIVILVLVIADLLYLKFKKK